MTISESELAALINDYKNGINLTQKYSNESEVIQLAYELQAGSYTEIALQQSEIHEKFCVEISTQINSFCNLSEQNSLLEVGIGEGNSILGISSFLNFSGKYFGVDLSFSRLTWCEDNFFKANIPIRLAVADALALPFSDESMDVLLTIHAIEPNGGKEEQILNELARVTRNYLILIEPDFEKGDIQIKSRMKSLGYVENIRKYFSRLDFELILDKQIINNKDLNDGISLNPSTIFILKRKRLVMRLADTSFCTPSMKLSLRNLTNGLISSNGIYYPKVGSIPFLRPMDALYILRPKFELS